MPNIVRGSDILPVALRGKSTDEGDTPLRALSFADAVGNGADRLLVGSFPLSYNGATWDMQRGNTEGTLLASAARTATTVSAVQTNHNARGVLIHLNITEASGLGGLRVHIESVDPVSGGFAWLNPNPTAITATGLYLYEVSPGGSTAGAAGAGIVNQRTAGSVPRFWRVNVEHGDVTSYTYSLGYSLIL